MAFQLALNALSATSHRDSSLHPVLESVNDSLRHSLITFPWMVPSELIPFLLHSGIPTSGLGTTPHPHATHKVIETFLLHHHWSFLATTPSSVMFMKPAKFRKLQNKNANFLELINFRLTPTDSVRFPTTSPHLPTHPTIFMHDALMYYHPSQILDLFSRLPHLQKLHASLVVPPESTFTDLSLHPNLYTYTIQNQTLHYIPENHAAGSYNQPLQASSWLRINSISHHSLTLTVTILESWGPVHSLLIQRGLPPLDPKFSLLPDLSSPPLFCNYLQPQTDQVSFQIPDAIELPSATFLRQPLRHRLVPTAVYNALFTYTRAVRTLRTSDPAGFVRTQSNKPEHAWVTSNAWDNLQTFALLTCPIRPNVSYHLFQNPIHNLQLYLSQHWRRLAATAVPFLSFLTLLPTFLPLYLPLPKVKCISAFHHSFHPKPLVPNPSLPPPIQTGVHLLSSSPLQPLLSFLQLLTPAPTPFLPRCQFRLHPTRLRLPLKVSIASLVLPELWLLASKLFGPVSLQAQHDTYHATLHPSKFNLSWERQSLSCPSLIPFLPFEPAPPPAPHFPQLPSLPLEFPSPLIPPTLTPAAIPPPETPTPTLPPEATPAPPSPPPSSNPILSSAPHLSPSTPSNPQDLFPEISQIPLPANPLPPPQINHSSQITPPSSSTLNSTSANPSLSDPPPQILSSLHLAPLEADFTAVGPVLPFSTLHPRQYPPDTADFPTRLRVTPPTDLPLPQNSCLLTALEPDLHINASRMWQALQELLPDSLLANSEVKRHGFSTDILTALCHIFHFKAVVHADSGVFLFGPQDLANEIHINHTSGPPSHFSPNSRLVGAQPTPSPDSTLARQAKRFTLNGNYLPFHHVHQFTTSLRHAKNLISNMKNGFDGILSTIEISTRHASGCSPKDKIIELDRLVDTLPPKTVSLIHLAGFAGCGKTHPVQKLLLTKPFSQFRVSCPTTELRNEWKNDMKLPSHESWKFCTWESSLLKSTRILVIDEIYKMPRGYLDLAILADPSLEFVIILGDPLQGEYHSQNPSSSNNLLVSERDRLSSLIDVYCWWSYRIPRNIAQLFNIQTFNPNEGFLVHSFAQFPSHNPDQPVLTNSVPTSLTLGNLGHHALTISASQGLTFTKPVTILLDNYTRLLSASNTLVALTRSKAGIEFVGSSTFLSDTNNSSAMFSKALAGQHINLQTFFPSLFWKLNLITSPITARRTRLLGSHMPPDFHGFHHKSLPPHIPVDFSGDFVLSNPVVNSTGPEERLDCHFLPPTRLPLHSDLCPSLPEAPSPQKPDFDSKTPITAVYPGENFENLAAFFLPNHDPQVKEISWKDQTSNQFPWFDRPFHLSCQPSSLISARHSPASDPTLLPASIKKRLRFRPSEHPHVLTSNDIVLGNVLFHSLCRAYNRNPSLSVPFNPALFAECISINDYAQLSSKTKATIVANASRSDPDWRFTAVKIFAKAQHKVNDGSIFGSWKACQTLALMHDFVILTLGPVKKYQRFFDNSDRPPHIYSHCGKTPQQLSDWCQNHLSPSTTKLANDYTAFDQSQHGESVILEALKMKRLNIPEHLIHLHIHLKTNVSTQFGPLTCMRLTGEPGTYDDNTDYNLAVIFSQYQIGSTPVMVSGDDSLIDRLPPLNPSWPDTLRLLHLRFKPEVTTKPLFCGYYVGSQGAVRNPLALFAKLMIAVDDETIAEKRLSYLTEFSLGHNLGNALWDVIPDSHISFQSACFDFFCRHAPKHEKLLLNPDLPDYHILSSLTTSAKWLSRHALFALPSHLRRKLVSFSQSRSFPENPDVSRLESELLHHFQ
uniref:Non-structural replication polyprotein n=1 Tax=Valeriana jatamansi tymovirus 1 TaxID=3075581 RepID=A0AA96HEA5_9VIRU|nr:replicase protein [Valeriana jatamansi tymovirus 1]